MSAAARNYHLLKGPEMRRTVSLAAAALIATAVGLFIAAPAHAAGTSDVLTTGSVGGANVAVNDVISSSLKSGTSAKFTTQSGGTSGVTCTASTFTGTVLTNPAAGGDATESLTAQTFGSCTSNITGVTAVQSIIVNNLPYNADVNGTSKAITLTGGTAGVIQATVKLSTLFGTVTCAYQANSNTITGTTSNTDNSLAFTNAGFSKSSGPIVCPSTSFLTATYAPAADTTVTGSPAVFVQ
jgi:hypothetical protein